MKRLLTLLVAVIIIAFACFPFPAHAVSAKSGIAIDAQTGRILYEKNANQRSLIASTTKIMTALIVAEQCNVLDRMQIPKEAVGIEGSSMYLKEGEVLTVQELLYGLMLHSGNDAAVALAIYCGGTQEGFVQLMNDKARQLGLSDTHFENPNGLDSPNHYSTASDLATLTAYAMKNPIFSQTVSTKTVKIGERYLTNHNKLLWRVEGADGVKTGYTRAAGRILVSSATRQSRRLIAVTINDPNDWIDHKKLLDAGFSQFRLKQIVQKGEILGTISVVGGKVETVNLIANEDFIYALREDERTYFVCQGPGFAYAPVYAGEDAGVVYVCIGDSPVGKISVSYEKTVEKPVKKENTGLVERFLKGLIK